MIKQDFILLIFNCEKYRYKALKQKDTWLQQLPPNIIYYHVLGQEQSPDLKQEKGQSPDLKQDLKQDYIIDEQERVLYVNVADDYNSLPKKVIAAYKAINSIYDFKYIFKTDDDQNVKNTRFFNILMIILKTNANANKSHYGGHIVDIKRPEVSTYYRIHPELPKNLILNTTRYCSGRFYFLSWEAVQKLLERENDIQNEYFEDYAIGYYLPPHLKNNMLQLDTDKHFNDFHLSIFDPRISKVTRPTGAAL
jgi:hypothetical protein